MDIEMFSKLWPIITGAGTAIFILIVWCVRLEAKVLYLEKDHEDQKIHASEKHDTIWTKMDGMQGTLNSALQGIGKLEGKIDALFETGKRNL